MPVMLPSYSMVAAAPLWASSAILSMESSARVVVAKVPAFGPPISRTVNHAVAAASSIDGTAVALAATNGVASGRALPGMAVISSTSSSGSELYLLASIITSQPPHTSLTAVVGTMVFAPVSASVVTASPP